MDIRKLKGNLGLKSSALAPTACKLSSQFLVLDHMSNHYMKIAKAKSAVDSRPPKSLMASQKMRDRISRDLHVASPQPRPYSSMSGAVLTDYRDILQDEPEDEEEKLVHSIMRSTLLGNSSSNKATYGAEHHSFVQEHISTNVHDSLPYAATMYDHPASIRSVRSGHSLTTSPSRVAIPAGLSVLRMSKADVLDKRPHLFTEPARPFTPRTLKKNTESRLKKSKCYNPPGNKSARKEHEIENSFDKNNKKNTSKSVGNSRNETQKPQSKFQSPPPHSRRPHKVPEYPEGDLEYTTGASRLSDSMLMDISLRSRDETHNQEVNHGVPPLAITMDKDHMNWLQEQASKAEVRVRSSGRLKSSLHPDAELHPVSRHQGPRKSDKQQDGHMEKLRNIRPMGLCKTFLPYTPSPSSEWISQRLFEEDEEQKYLAFAREVTDDVLSRGISSDSVLDKVFENHIVRRKDDLEESRMRNVISDLRKNLGLKESFTEQHSTSLLSNSNYSNKARNNRMTSSSSAHQQNSKKQLVSGKEIYQMSAHSYPNSTVDSVNTLQFGQTGDVLSTIHSEASLDNVETLGKQTLDRLGHDIEMTTSQTLREYQLSLTEKEEMDVGASGAGGSLASKEMKYSYHQQQPETEAGIDGDDKLKYEIPSVKTQRRRSRRFSQKTKDVGHISNMDIDEKPSGVAGSHRKSENHEHAVEDSKMVSSVEKIDDDTSPEGSIVATNQHDEDVSVQSSLASQRPVARPRARARQGSHERAQTETTAAGDHEASHVQQEDVWNSATGDINSKTSSQEGPDTAHRAIVASARVGHARELSSGAGNSRESLSTGAGNAKELRPETPSADSDHSQTAAEDAEYEDDYEEVIESEDDSKNGSADDF